MCGHCCFAAICEASSFRDTLSVSCWVVSWKQLNRVVLLDAVLTSPCRWQVCPSLSHLLWLDKISKLHQRMQPFLLPSEREDNFRFDYLKGPNLQTFCSFLQYLIRHIVVQQTSFTPPILSMTNGSPRTHPLIQLNRCLMKMLFPHYWLWDGDRVEEGGGRDRQQNTVAV